MRIASPIKKNFIPLIVGDVVNKGLCVGCGACVAIAGKGFSSWNSIDGEATPLFNNDAYVCESVWEACPGKGIDFNSLSKSMGYLKSSDSRLGYVNSVYVGFSGNSAIRRNGASGGVMTSILIYLLESGLIDCAILAKQNDINPRASDWTLARSRAEILGCSQSVYINVPMLESLPFLNPKERYAITTLPEQTASLRILQRDNISNSRSIKYILGPYTGTYLKTNVIDFILQSHGINKNASINYFKWRDGEWPGYLSIKTEDGKEVRMKKVYYNYLIPFFINNVSLQSIDFTNEFTDLSVGDAWSPKYEKLGQGYSVVISRSEEMTRLLNEMTQMGFLKLRKITIGEAADMHGHMIDFKKRGSYIRNKIKLLFTGIAPDFGIKPVNIPISRWIIELIIFSIFFLCRTRIARFFLLHSPKWFIGPVFNFLRLAWKNVSKPSKRKGLGNIQFMKHTPRWKFRLDE